MNAEVWIGLAALTLNGLVLAVGYGVLKGTVTATFAALDARLKAVEAEVTSITKLGADVARIDARTDAMNKNLDRLLDQQSGRRRATGA